MGRASRRLVRDRVEESFFAELAADLARVGAGQGGVEVPVAPVTPASPVAPVTPAPPVAPVTPAPPVAPGAAIPAGFPLGWVGWLGYEARFAAMGEARTRDGRHPEAAFLFLDRAVEFDHASGRVALVALGSEWAGELREWRDGVERALTSPPSAAIAPSASPAVARWHADEERYLAEIEACREAIVRGDAYQLCLTNEATVAGTHDPVEVYLRLRTASPSHHGAIIRVGGIALLSASPEQFLRVTSDRMIVTKPIKGTRPRGRDLAQDAALRAELLESEKERAENLMIVDLMRNDIARVSELGSVEVTSLNAVESYAQVHQLVSTVRGRLAPGLTGVDAVVACFPAGSMTGAPKRSATRILDRLEGRPRGVYAGAFGWFGVDGTVDLAMTIRSIVIDGEGATIGAGGGITALSVPAEELAEVRLKAAVLLACVGAGAGHPQL
ncbi:anthranilate synthase component I family protein [Galbitalea soli]|uniref:Anthranilate synthase component I family protein n=2 Tax=Galbitalea soli TaxID=1268042 RepID=A0A7C9PL52_9MICO|nr:anthranilate synthase component I family protein [Galbitalea soli]